MKFHMYHTCVHQYDCCISIMKPFVIPIDIPIKRFPRLIDTEFVM